MKSLHGIGGGVACGGGGRGGGVPDGRVATTSAPTLAAVTGPAAVGVAGAVISGRGTGRHKGRARPRSSGDDRGLFTPEGATDALDCFLMLAAVVLGGAVGAAADAAVDAAAGAATC